MAMNYFSCLGRTGTDSTKSALGHITPAFFASVGTMVHIVHSGASRAQNIDALFFMIR
jgi:hypothetical protein